MTAWLAPAASLLGGIFQSKSNRRKAAQERLWALEDYQTQRNDALNDQAQHWVRHREASERAGFNPLATLGATPAVASSSITPTSSPANVMGQSFADAGLLLADGLSKAKEQSLQAEQLRIHNQKLTERVRALTFNPTVAGVYQNDTSTSVLDSGSSLVPLSGGFLADERRETRINPNINSSGSVTIQPPGSKPLSFPSIDGEEIMSPLDLLWFGALATPQILYQTFNSQGRAEIAAEWRALRNESLQKRQNWAARALRLSKPKASSNPDHTLGW